MESAQLNGVLTGDFDVALPLGAVTFRLFKRVAKAIAFALVGLVVLVLLCLKCETRRKVAEVVSKVVHDCSRDHLARGALLKKEYRGRLS